LETTSISYENYGGYIYFSKSPDFAPVAIGNWQWCQYQLAMVPTPIPIPIGNGANTSWQRVTPTWRHITEPCLHPETW
jgi:hypothetical protein